MKSILQQQSACFTDIVWTGLHATTLPIARMAFRCMVHPLLVMRQAARSSLASQGLDVSSCDIWVVCSSQISESAVHYSIVCLVTIIIIIYLFLHFQWGPRLDTHCRWIDRPFHLAWCLGQVLVGPEHPTPPPPPLFWALPLSDPLLLGMHITLAWIWSWANASRHGCSRFNNLHTGHMHSGDRKSPAPFVISSGTWIAGTA